MFSFARPISASITALVGATALTLAVSGSPAAAATRTRVSPLPRSDYATRAVCPAPAPGRAACQAYQLVPRTEEARAHTHPLGVARALLATPTAPPTAAAGDFGLRPQDLHSAYGLPITATKSQTVALVDAYNDLTAEEDLATYAKEFSLPECTTANGCFEKVNQSGESGNLPFPKSAKELETARKGGKAAREEAEEASGWALEISLDIETTHAVCESCHIVLVEATIPSFEDLERGERTAETLGAGEISNSFAGSEQGESNERESASPFDHPGTVITASSGDHGYLNWDQTSSTGKGFANFPAASPHVIAVGGTRLSLGEGGGWAAESVWNGDGAGGGGCSTIFTAQPWQQAVSDWSTVGCSNKRAVADVSADADPYTGVAVYDSGVECEFEFKEGKVKGHWCTIGGTSLSSPLIASTFALAGGANGVEYPARTLYEGESRSASALHDITQGSNGECTKPFNEKTGLSGCTSTEEAEHSCASKAVCLAAAGYDGPSGVGTPAGLAAFEPPPAVNPPTVATGGASAITQSTATVAATVNPNGSEVTSCTLEYGTTTKYGASQPCTPTPGSATNPVTVTATLTGLNPNTPYHYRITATNTGGTSNGTDSSFQTLPNPPTVATGGASAITQSTATVAATVNPNGSEVTSCTLEYGTTTKYGSSQPCTPTPGSATNPVTVTATLTGLNPNTPYHYRITATNTGGTSNGTDSSFQTLPNPPTVATGGASAITQSTATVAATVNPNGSEVTSCTLEYGTTTKYGSSQPCTPTPGSATNPVTVTATLTGLNPNTPYHYRITATNTGGTSNGTDSSFQTLPNPPGVQTEAPTGVSASAATMNATVNPNGGEVTSCQLEYGPTTSYGSNQPCTPTPGSATNPVTVTATLTGLNPSSNYHYRVVATNAGGTSYGADEIVTTLAAAPEFGRCLKVGRGLGSYANSSCTSSGGSGSYEWTPGVLGDAFTIASTSSSTTLETTAGARLRCTAASATGSYAGVKVVADVVLTLSGCELAGESCASGSVAGEIVSLPLEGMLGVDKLGASASKDKVGLDLLPAMPMGSLMQFGCGSTTVSIDGSVILALTANKMSASAAVKFKAKKGHQEPEAFLSGPRDVLEASFNGGIFEQAGLTVNGVFRSEEAVEVNSVV